MILKKGNMALVSFSKQHRDAGAIPGGVKRGHYRADVRAAARAAFMQWLFWNGTAPEPVVDAVIDRQPFRMRIGEVCEAILGCDDIVPVELFDRLAAVLGAALKGRRYGNCAEAILDDLEDLHR